MGKEMTELDWLEREEARLDRFLRDFVKDRGLSFSRVLGSSASATSKAMRLIIWLEFRLEEAGFRWGDA